MIQFFDNYVRLGLKPIPIFKNSKTPVESAWNKNWSEARWRKYFQDNNCNMGILLGDIVDVEADSEEGNDLLERMIDGCERPRFRSSKSTHNLFINPDPELTRLVVCGIEFRGNLHQSVVPPSSHENGILYAWIAGSKFPIPEMPDELKRFYFQNKKRKLTTKGKPPPPPRIRQGISKTECNSCHRKYPLHRSRIILEVKAFRKYGLLWQCRNCRSIDIRQDCRDIRKSLER